VRAGHMTILIGASGGGTSVILQLILGLLKPNSGTHARPWRALCEETDMPWDQVRRPIEEVLGFIGLEEYIDRTPSELSGRQLPRIAGLRRYVDAGIVAGAGL
jgi:ABC-type sugar transport system ATPase subunit